MKRREEKYKGDAASTFVTTVSVAETVLLGWRKAEGSALVASG